MRRKKRAFNYAEVQIQTASPGQRVVMMYDGILKHLRLAHDALMDLSAEKYETVNNNLQMAERFILELKLALDFEQGGEFATQMNDLYEFWIRHISDANMDNDAAKVAEVIEMARDLRDTWSEATQKARTA